MKKYVLSLSLLILSLMVYSQNCSDLVRSTYDKMTGNKSVSQINPQFVGDDSEGIGYQIFKNKDGYVFVTFMPVGASECVEDDSKILFLFTNGEKMRMQNNGKFNCNGLLDLYFMDPYLIRNKLKSLSDKRIETIRIHTMNGFVQVDFSALESRKFQNILNCVIDTKFKD